MGNFAEAGGFGFFPPDMLITNLAGFIAATFIAVILSHAGGDCQRTFGVMTPTSTCLDAEPTLPNAFETL